MMWWDGPGYGMTGWAAVLMIIGTLLVWALAAAGAVVLVRVVGRGSGRASQVSAEQILAVRFARGEIEEAEYRDRMVALRELCEPLTLP